jgi:hypothetical protein
LREVKERRPDAREEQNRDRRRRREDRGPVEPTRPNDRPSAERFATRFPLFRRFVHLNSSKRLLFNDLNAKTSFFFSTFFGDFMSLYRTATPISRATPSHFANFSTKSQETSKRAARFLATKRRVFAKSPKLTRFRR